MTALTPLVLDAVYFATLWHGKATRRDSGLPYVIHCFSVARGVCMHYNFYIEAGGTMPLETLVIAALLHDVVEDTDITLDAIRERYDEPVASLVAELTTDEAEKQRLGGKTTYLTEKMRTLSIDALFIKLLDRLDNVVDYKKSGVTPRSLAYAEQTCAMLEEQDAERLKPFEPIVLCIMGVCDSIQQVVNTAPEPLAASPAPQ